jgi:hypothetical protein
VLDACDIVSIGGEDWHIDAITRDIIVEEPVPTTSRVGTLVLILLLALIGLVMVVRARRRMVQAAS